MARVFPLALVFLAACGGSSGVSKSAGTAKDRASASSATEPSIGDAVVAQGGLSALGGAGNREPSGGGGAVGSLRADMVDKASPVKLDGVLTEWPARTPAKITITGAPAATTFAAAVQYDDAKVYVGGEVTETSFVRTARFGDGEDRASLVLAFPGGASAAYEIAFFAGKPGESEGSVRFAAGARKGQEVPGAKIVEAPEKGGYTFEAEVPWSTFPEARVTRVGLRAAARYYDAEPGGVRSVVATGTGDASSPATLPSLPTEPEQAVIEGLLAPRGIAGQAARLEILADITGDAMKERIAVYDKFLTICGPSYRGGKEYYFKDLGGELVHLEASLVTGRNKEDLVLRRRFATPGGSREWFEVWSLLGGDEPVTSFAHEIAVASAGKHVSNAVHVSGHEIEVSVEPAVGWDQATYREPTTTDVQPVLLPWNGVKSRVFRFDGTHYLKAKEVAQTPLPGASPTRNSDSTRPAPPDPEPATPLVRRNTDLSAQLLEQYKKDHNLPPETRAKVDLQVHVDGDTRPERVVLIGRDIVVFGPGFKGGTQYALITLQQFDAEGDIHDLVARDLTGAGAANLIVRGTRHIKAAGSGDVAMDAMFVYEVKAAALSRIFGIETGREQGTKRVQGLVQFVPAKGGKGFEIDVRPGLAKGWTAKSYPWSQEQPGSGAIEPVLLPWGGIPHVRYVWNGTAFTR